MAEAFVGRAAELAALSELARRVGQERQPAAALILGAPGHGKSRLLAEARAFAPFPALSMVGYEPDGEAPLAAASGLLRTLAGHAGSGDPLESLLKGEQGGGALEA